MKISFLFFLSPLLFGQMVTNLQTSETFVSIQAAINDSDTLDGHQLACNAADFIEPQVTLNKRVSIIGTGSGPGQTYLETAILIQVPGPITLQDFRLSSPANHGIRTQNNVPNLGNLNLINLRVENCQNSGVFLNGDFEISNVRAENCEFVNNQEHGFRSNSRSITNFISIIGCTISDNQAPGLIINGASNDFVGEARNWVIQGGEISRNCIGAPNWGGGVWMYTPNNGVLDNITFDGVAFVDNGGNSIHNYGVTSFCRAGTLVRNISFVSCYFGNTVGGQQKAGIEPQQNPNGSCEPFLIQNCTFENMLYAFDGEETYGIYQNDQLIIACEAQNTFASIGERFHFIRNLCDVPALSPMGSLTLLVLLGTFSLLIILKRKTVKRNSSIS